MGDRANIAVIHKNKDQIWLYSHWGGSGLHDKLQEGLRAGKGRWNDESYLTKIIFGYAVPCDKKSWHGETGYGISGRLQDNEYPVLVVDIEGQRVLVVQESRLTKDGKVPDDLKPGQYRSWPFEQYLELIEDPRRITVDA